MPEVNLKYNLSQPEIPIFDILSIEQYVGAVVRIATVWREHAKQRDEVRKEPFPGEIVPWFRGMTDAMYPCEPGLLRAAPDFVARYNKTPAGIAGLEDYMHHRFRGPALPYSKVGMASTALEWMFLQQHHGLPTRLLDWTKNSLVALYFAVRKNKGLPAAVWVIDPRRLNEACGHGRRISAPANKKADKIGSYIKGNQESWVGKYPIPVIPPHISDRLAAQQSRFTLHAPQTGGIQDFALASASKDGLWHVACLRLPGDHKDILRSLRLLGITEVEITPGLDTLSSEILHRMQLGFDDLDFGKGDPLP